jgi:GH15 family glucan-1,4-alpha-glucosidase
MSLRIEDYAMIGDCRGAGLVARNGSLDWLCVPRFDSPACLAALLGNDEHGRWLIAPRAEPLNVRRRYQGETLVLETEFETHEGVVALIDCMLPSSTSHAVQVVRYVEGRRGRVTMHTELVVRFDYGSIVPWVTHEDHAWRFIAGPDTLHLYTQVELEGQGLTTVGEFSVGEGERVSFVLSHHASHLPDDPAIDAVDAVRVAKELWESWSKRSTYRGDYREAVQRSLLVLKSLTYQPTGGIVAAPTTSLPEQLGGPRNWDYRFCWLRDSTITLYALMLAGYTNEAQRFREWLLRAIAGSPAQVQVMYGIAGERRLSEQELPWLPGYADSKPVRTGNAAHTQLQLDVFGELMDVMHQCRRVGMDSDTSWALERKLLSFLEEHWQDPDEGIWEVRGPRRHFTYSKVMAWVAFDRAVKAITEFGCEGPLDRYCALRDAIHRDVCEHAYSEEKQSFVMAYDHPELDASLLQIPLVGFLPASDARVQGTIAAIERELLVRDCFVLRYKSQAGVDGLPEGEGAFLACSFWLVSNYVMQGRRDDARALFERLLLLRNDVGLLSEEYDVRGGRQLGNFPQAFSHLALIDAAQMLSEPEHGSTHHRLAPEKSTGQC